MAGMAKAGIHGAGMLMVPLLAIVFGGLASTGVLLPILIFADIVAVMYYHRHASWPHLRLLFPWTAAGILLGTVVGGMINDQTFTTVMAGIIFVSVAIMIWLERGHRQDVPDYKWFGALMGVLAGFTSMVGNLAAAIMIVYLLSMRLPKNVYIGTTAWFFILVNLFKLPFHIFAWHTVNTNTFLLDLTTIPSILAGAALGIYIVRIIPELYYRWFLIFSAMAGAVYMLV